jgi:Xaa-Pro aminopeptidase
METPMIKKALASQHVNADVTAYETVEDLPNLLRPLLQQKKIALNFGENMLSMKGTGYADYLRVGDYLELKNLAPKTQFVSAAPLIYSLRSVKSDEEIKELQETIKPTVEVLNKIPEWTKIGMTENELKAKIEYEFLKLGKPSFDSIIAFGPNAADPHYNTGNKKIEKGVLLVDIGLKIKNMCSDLTWTYWVGGKPSEEFLKAYHALYQAKEISYQYMKIGSPLSMADVKLREYLASQGYDHIKLYTHGLGHALGFETHDIGPRCNWKIPTEFVWTENMVYSNEPGLYWEGKFGIRLEDDVVLRKNGVEKLSTVPKEPPLI